MSGTKHNLFDYDYDLDIIAVISSVKEYKLAWAINKLLKLNLCKCEDLVLDFIKEGRILVSNFTFETEYTTFRLLKNKVSSANKVNVNYLIPELKEYDYLITIAGERISFNSDFVVEMLKQVSVVEYIKQIDIQNLKSKDNLIF